MSNSPVERKSFSELFTFSRGRSLKYFDSQNVLKTATAQQPVYPAGGIALQNSTALGLVENNRDYFLTPWSNQGANTTVTTDVGRDGETQRIRVVDGNTNSAGSYYQDVANPDPDGTWDAIFSVYIRKLETATHYPAVSFTLSGGNSNSDYIIIDAVNGTWTRWELSNGTNPVTIEDDGDWWRVQIGVSNDGSGAHTFRPSLVASANTDGSGAVDPTATGTTTFDFPQFDMRVDEPLTPQHILDGTDPFFHDDLRLDNSDGWFNPDEFTFYGEITNLQRRATTNENNWVAYLFNYVDSAGNEVGIRQRNYDDLELVVSVGGNQAGFLEIPYVKDFKFALSVQGNGAGPCLFAYNGVGVDATGSLPVAGLLDDGDLIFNVDNTAGFSPRYFELRTFEALARAALLPELIELTQ